MTNLQKLKYRIWLWFTRRRVPKGWLEAEDQVSRKELQSAYLMTIDKAAAADLLLLITALERKK